MFLEISFYVFFRNPIIVIHDDRISLRIRIPHRVSREARIRALVLLENGVNVPPPAQSCVVLPKFRSQANPFSKHLIVSLLPVEEVPITPGIVTGGLGRVCGSRLHGAKIRYFQNLMTKVSLLSK